MICNYDLLKCGIVILLPLVRLKIELCLKSQNFRNMVKTSGKKILVKATAANPSGKPPSGDKTLGIESVIRFYSLEDVDETKEREEA